MKELLKVRCKVYIAAVFSLCVGKGEKIAGVDCYISSPSGDYAKEKVLLFLDWEVLGKLDWKDALPDCAGNC